MNRILQAIKADRNWSISVLALTLASGFLYLYKLAAGTHSEYYASIAVSMSKSLGNFFFGALDPAGNLTLDKIPGSYWVPAIFVRLFGFSNWAVDAPNALATVATVLIVAFTVRRLFGNTAGVVAGGFIIATPIITAVARSNQPESFFLLALALAVNRAVVAFQTTSRRSLIATGALLALAFHMYMIEAWAVWPALIAGWLVTRQTWRKKIVDLLIAGSVSLVLSMTWMVVVWLVPAQDRPYLGSTNHNNPFEMVFGYDALGRFSSHASSLSNASVLEQNYRSFTPPFAGLPGPGRFLNHMVAGQISWMIPAAIAAVILLVWLKQNRALVLFLTGWFATYVTMFSAVGGMHQFYVSSVAIPMTLLIASAVGAVLKTRKPLLLIWLVAPTAVFSIFLSAMYPGYFTWLPYVQVIFAAVTLGLLWKNRTHMVGGALKVVVAFSAAIAMSLTPLAWSADAAKHPDSTNPTAGPATVQVGHHHPKTQHWSHILARVNSQHGQIITYLRANRHGAKYLLVTFGAQTAARYITATGDNILPVGGFDGGDPSPTLDQFKQMVRDGQIRYVMAFGAIDQVGPQGIDRSVGATIRSWVRHRCVKDLNAPRGSRLYVCSQ